MGGSEISYSENSNSENSHCTETIYSVAWRSMSSSGNKKKTHTVRTQISPRKIYSVAYAKKRTIGERAKNACDICRNMGSSGDEKKGPTVRTHISPRKIYSVVYANYGQLCDKWW